MSLPFSGGPTPVAARGPWGSHWDPIGTRGLGHPIFQGADLQVETSRNIPGQSLDQASTENMGHGKPGIAMRPTVYVYIYIYVSMYIYIHKPGYTNHTNEIRLFKCFFV